MLAAGETVTCTITNTFIPPEPAHLTLTKASSTGGGTAQADRLDPVGQRPDADLGPHR